MWNLISHFLTFAGGMASGVMLMCLMQTGKLADKEFEGGIKIETCDCRKALCCYVTGSSIRRNGKKRRLSRRFRLSGELVRGTSFGTGTAGGLQRTVRQMAV